MTDVFISYARENRETARKLSSALEARGWSVWWDRNIQPGQSFDQAIERELEAAKCVVVLWSKDSVLSEWVKNEAAFAVEKGVLVPALLDDIRAPLEFRRRQAADLAEWDDDPSHPGFQGLCHAIAATTDTNTVARSLAAPAVRTWHWTRGWWIFAAIVTIAIALGAYWTLGDMLRTPDVSGRWDFEPSEKRYKTYLEFRMMEGKLMGREVISFPPLHGFANAREAAITDGKVVRDRISFKTIRTFDAQHANASKTGQRVQDYEGRIDGDKIYLSISISDGGYWEVTAVRRPKEQPAELTGELKGHDGSVERLVPLRDGRLASGARDKTVKIWNLATRAAEASLAHNSQVVALVPLPGERIVSAEYDGQVRIWNLQTGREQLSFKKIDGMIGDVIALGPERLAGGWSQGEITIWNIETGQIERTLKINDRWIVKLALLRDGRLATGDQDGTIRIWNLSSSQPHVIVREGKPGSNDSVTGLIELKDERLAFSTRNSKATTLWSQIPKESEKTLPVTPGAQVSDLAVLADGRLAILENSNLLTIWNPATAKRDVAFDVGGEIWAASGVVQLPDGRLVIGSGDGPIQLWRLR